MTDELGPSLLKKSLLTKSSEFENVFKKGKRLEGSYYVVYKCANALGYPRLGTVVSKKRCGGAVKRNRIKRVIREVFRLNKKLFDSYDVIVLAKENSHEIKYQHAFEYLKNTLTKRKLNND